MSGRVPVERLDRKRDEVRDPDHLTEVITTRLTLADVEGLNELRRRTGWQVSAIVRDAVREHLARHLR